MRVTKARLTAELLQIIKEIGVNEDDCLIFDLNNLLTRWNTTHKGQFKQYGYGKMSDYLRNEVGMQESDGKHWIKITDSDMSHETKKGACAQLLSHPANPVDADSISNFTASPRDDSIGPKSKEELLQIEVLTSIQEYMEKNPRKMEGQSLFTLEELDSAWTQKHPNSNFKKKGCGNFKPFLIDKLKLQHSKSKKCSDSFTITLDIVKNKLKHLDGGEIKKSSVSTQSGNDAKIEDGEESVGESTERDDCKPAATVNATYNDSNTVEGLQPCNEPNQICIQPESKFQTESASKSVINDVRVADKGFSEEE